MPTTLVIFSNEIYKRFMLLWAYRFNLFTQMFMIGLIFVGITFFMGSGALDPTTLASTLLGYLVWFYALSAISDMSWGIREEAQTGTLEQMYMSPLPTGLLLIGRSLASFFISTVMVVIVGTALVLILDVELPLIWQALPVFVLTMVGLYGFAFMLAGATIIFKQIEALANLLQNALLFLNGALLPVDRLPNWLEAVALTLPTTQGIIVLRQVVLEGEALARVWQNGELVWLLIHSLTYFGIGWYFFQWCELRAKEQGALGQY